MADEAKNNLDEQEIYSEVDPSGLRHRLRDIPRQCLSAWERSRNFSWSEFSLSGDRPSINKVVIGGMGGSAIAGDLAADLATGISASSSVPWAKMPILVVRDLSFPFSLDQGTIFIACSYSGNTEETRALFEQAVHQPCPRKARTIAISGGGILSQMAGDAGVPLLKIDVGSEPRTAVAYNLMLLLGVLRGLDLLELDEDQVTGAISAVSHNGSVWAEDVPVAENPAKRLALEFRDKLIIVYGSGLFSGMARRWKSQFNENAKIWSFFETLPETLHNSVEAFAFPIGQPTMALILEPGTENSIHSRHNRVFSKTLNYHQIPSTVLSGEGPTPLAQILNMLLLGDYVSYYLAVLRGVDPSPNPSIDAAKDLLSGLT